MSDGWREDCLQCGEEFGRRSRTNFCAVCCHNGLDDELRTENGFFVREPENDESPEVQLGKPTMAQAGLGDFA